MKYALSNYLNVRDVKNVHVFDKILGFSGKFKNTCVITVDEISTFFK